MAKGGKKGGRKQFTNVEELERERGGRRKADADSESDSEDDDDRPARGGNKGQSSNAGMLPPNSSDEEEDVKRARPLATCARRALDVTRLRDPDLTAPIPCDSHVPPLTARVRAAKGKKVQPGDLPPNSSEDDSSSDDDSSSGSPAPPPRRELTRKEREQLEAQRAKPDPELVAKELERLKLVREKRAAQAAARIAAEGFDRFAPPPGAKVEPNPLAESEETASKAEAEEDK